MSWRLLVRCVRGLEWVLAAELAAGVPDARAIRLGHRGVRATVSEVDSLRPPATADDLFLVVAEAPDLGRPKDSVAPTASALAAADWATPLAAIRAARTVAPGARFDVVASFAGKRNFNRYAVEDAVGAALAPRLGLTYASRAPGGPPPGPTAVTVRVFLDGDTVTGALRLAAAPAHRRAYKQATGPGTLHPPVAAALARIAAVTSGDTVLDPFCGDGTLAVEAALYAAHGPAHATVLATDRDPERLANTAANATRAATRVTPALADAGALPVRAGTVDVLLANPPWNLAVTAAGALGASLQPFWSAVPALLAPGGRLCVVADDELGAPAAIRRAGLITGLEIRVRLAGRVSRILLAGADTPRLPADLAHWRTTAQRAGLAEEVDF